MGFRSRVAPTFRDQGETGQVLKKKEFCKISKKINANFRYFSDLCSLKICSLYHASKPDHCTSPSWEVFRPVHAMTKAHSAVLDHLDFEEGCLRNNNAAFYNSAYNQIVPSKTMFWLQNVKNS